MLSYLLIRTKHGKGRIALDKLLKHKEFLEVHSVFGRYDLICLLDCENTEELKTFLQNKVWIIEEIERVESLIASATQDVISVNEPEEELEEDGQFITP